MDVWYPAAPNDEPMSVYELMPGVAFEAATARHEPPVADGTFPLVVFSHGRTGMRFAYSMRCEALAARGVVAPEIHAVIDHDRVAMAGHSHGAFTALATAGGDRGVSAHEQVRAVLCFQPFTRTMSDDTLEGVDVPVLLVVSEQDAATPASTAADAIGPGLRPWRELVGVQVRAAWAFLPVTLELDPTAGLAAADQLATEPGITLRRR